MTWKQLRKIFNVRVVDPNGMCTCNKIREECECEVESKVINQFLDISMRNLKLCQDAINNKKYSDVLTPEKVEELRNKYTTFIALQKGA